MWAPMGLQGGFKVWFPRKQLMGLEVYSPEVGDDPHGPAGTKP